MAIVAVFFSQVFRLLRSLRPLRVINRAPGLKLVVQTLLSSLKPIGNIVLICCTFFIIFGILGVQVMKCRYRDLCRPMYLFFAPWTVIQRQFLLLRGTQHPFGSQSDRLSGGRSSQHVGQPRLQFRRPGTGLDGPLCPLIQRRLGQHHVHWAGRRWRRPAGSVY